MIAIDERLSSVTFESQMAKEFRRTDTIISHF